MKIPDVLGDYGLWQSKAFAVIIYSSIPLCFSFYSGIFIMQNGISNCQQNVLNETLYNSKYHELYGRTLPMEWNIQCDDVWMQSLTHIVFIVGIISAVIFGPKIGNSFGRRPLNIIGVAVMLLSSSMSGLSPTYAFFLSTKLVSGFGYGTQTLASQLLVKEICHPKTREMIWFCSELMWLTSLVCLPFIVWTMPNWRLDQIVTSVPFCIVLLIMSWWLYPESPAWLLSVCNYSRTQRILQEAAETNGIQILNHGSVLSSLQTPTKPSKADASKPTSRFENTFSRMTNKISRQSLKLDFVSCFDLFANLGVLLSLEFLEWNLYYSLMAIGIMRLVSLPSYFIIRSFVAQRKIAIFGFGTGSVLYFLTAIFIQNETPALCTGLAMSGQYVHNIASLVYRYPLKYENDATSYFVGGFMHGKYGALVATILYITGYYISYIPFILFGSALVCCTALSWI